MTESEIIGSPSSPDLVADAGRTVILAEGDEATSYLHGQLSQDVESLDVGATTWSFLLEPQGKVIGHLRLHRLSAEAILIDVDAGTADAVQTSLERFKLRTRVEFSRPGWPVIGVRGAVATAFEARDGVIALPTLWPDPAVDVVVVEGELGLDLDLVDDATWESARIVAGVAVVGTDIDGSTIPQESGLVDRSVSFAKGCYRGQELVERIQSRGAVRKGLCHLHSEGSLSVGDSLTLDGKEMGSVTSATPTNRGGTAALGYVRSEAFAGVVLTAPTGAAVSVSPLVVAD